MAITSELLFTHPRCFGVTTASPIQRAILRAADGLPLGELALDAGVIKAFGGPVAIANLPPRPPRELNVVAAIRCGKSLMAAAIAVKIALTADMTKVDPSETAVVPIVSVRRKNAKIVMQHVMRALNRRGGALERYLVKKPRPTGEEVTIRRDDGRLVEICIAAGSKAGSNLVSRWCLCALFDEAARMQGQEDGVINYEDQRDAIIIRLGLIDGQLVAITSPWAARGPIYETVRDYTGPSEALVLVRGTGPEVCPANWPAAKVEKMRLDPAQEAAYTTDCLGEFADVEAGFLLAADIDKPLGARTAETIPREPGWFYVAAMDPGLRGNSWTLVIVAYRPSDDGDPSGDRFAVARTRQWTGSRKEPLNVASTLTDVRDELRVYGTAEAWTDQWGAEFIKQSGETVGVDVREDTGTAAEKDERHITFRSKLLAGQVEPTPEPQWRADMLSARIKRTPNGQKLELPLTRDGRHADYVPATLLAMAKAQGGPGWADLLTSWKAKGNAVVF